MADTPKNALKHGGGAAETAITAGQPFTGLAAEQEARVRDELELDGLEAIVLRDAIRMQTVADLYFQAILGADSLEKFDAYVKRFGWIASSALRAWQAVREMQKKSGRADISAILKALDNDTD